MPRDARVRFALDGDVGRLVLADAARRNAIDLRSARELRAGLERCAAEPCVRALLIDAEGADFSVGGDLDGLAGRPDDLEARVLELVEVVQDATARVAELGVPVVCAARGAVAGAALGLLLGADVAIVADDLKLVAGFAGVGLSGDGGASWYLPRLAGHRRAQELLMENRRLGADEALAWGLVSRVVPADALGDEALRAARALAAGPTVALGRMRALLRAGSPTLREHLAAEAEALGVCARTDDLPAALAAFAERRPPRFEGR